MKGTITYHIRYISLMTVVLVAAWLMPSCATDNELVSEVAGKETVVTFRPTVANSLPTRAVSDGKLVDRLMVKVYDSKGKLFLELNEMLLADAQKNGVSLTLIDGQNYQVLFYAYDEDNTAYTLTDDGILIVNYENYLNSGFAGMEQLDVFCTVENLTATEGATPTVTLIRPTAQLNFVDTALQPINGTHRAVVTLKNIPNALNLLTGEASGEVTQAFTFADYTGETIKVDGEAKDAWYVSTNYVLVPATGSKTVSATIDLQTASGESLKKPKDVTVLLEKNKRTNVIGDIVMMPVTVSGWDGITLSEPERDSENRYIIDEASDLAWLKDNGHTLEENRTFLVKTDIDMSGKELTSLQLPAGSTLTSDDKVRTIKNVKLTNGGLFGDVTNLSVSNLNFEDIIVENCSTHVGALVNTLRGSSSFSGVTVKKTNIKTTNGAAGGIVGYIVRESEKDRAETLAVTFDDCRVESNAIEGTVSEGHFVGLFSGYDNNETLSFTSTCSVKTSENDIKSYYTNSNKACFVDTELFAYDGWVGRENYYRGIVNYGGTRFIPKWDGTTKVEPLVENGNKAIYSAFDLANQQDTSAGNLMFIVDVDMASAKFEPLTYISALYGNDKTIYNLKIDTQWDTDAWSGGAFARRCAGGIFENITFKDANVRVTHSSSDGDAYAAIVCATLEGDPVRMTNVKVEGGSLYGVNKMGGIAGYIVSGLNCTNCSVDGLSIENYDSGGKDSFGFKANGEVGGMFGFIAANANISGCYVKNTTLDCIGVNNGRVLFAFKYAGRHVNEFIGDIRTTSGQNIVISYVDANFTNNKYNNRKDQYKECNKIGHCYYTNISAFGIGITDTKGTVTVNGKSITVAENY